jgi:hypothetical protein
MIDSIVAMSSSCSYLNLVVRVNCTVQVNGSVSFKSYQSGRDILYAAPCTYAKKCSSIAVLFKVVLLPAGTTFERPSNGDG